jgi:hypothetical protein
MFGSWLSAIGYWLLAIGYWLLAIGYRLLAVGWWSLLILSPLAFLATLATVVYLPSCRLTESQ